MSPAPKRPGTRGGSKVKPRASSKAERKDIDDTKKINNNQEALVEPTPLNNPKVSSHVC